MLLSGTVCRSCFSGKFYCICISKPSFHFSTHAICPFSFFCNSALDLSEGCFKYPLVEQYLKTKRFSRCLVVKYLACRGLTLLILLLACVYLGYYIRLASLTDEFSCDLRTGVLKNDSTVPSAVQCKLVAVGVFGLLSQINLVVYVLLSPLVVYAALGPARQSSSFLRPYEMLPGFGALGVVTPFYNDLSIYLLFLQENLSQLKSFKYLQVGQSTDIKGPVWIRYVTCVCRCFCFEKVVTCLIYRCLSCCKKLVTRGLTPCAYCELWVR